MDGACIRQKIRSEVVPRVEVGLVGPLKESRWRRCTARLLGRKVEKMKRINGAWIIGLVMTGGVWSANGFYDPGPQRWLNRDPLGERGGINLYRFAEADPISLHDADGRILGSHYPGRKYPEGPFDCGIRIKNEVWRDFGVNRPANDPSARKAHCIAHCRITRECPGGRFTSWLAGC